MKITEQLDFGDVDGLEYEYIPSWRKDNVFALTAEQRALVIEKCAVAQVLGDGFNFQMLYDSDWEIVLDIITDAINQQERR